MFRVSCVVASLLIGAPSVLAQQADPPYSTEVEEPLPLPEAATQQGKAVESAVGRVGKRQGWQDAKGINPLTRIDNRLRNRVQNRLRTRIDPNYSVDDAVSSLQKAEKEIESRPR